MNRHQLRPWLYASVAVALFAGLLFFQIDTKELYQSLQTQLKKTGIQLDAKSLNLSLMYTGSIRLDDAHIQAKAFDAEIQQLYLDLDLPALLTGKPIAQALFLHHAEINVLNSDKDVWLGLAQTDSIKLKRIDISQSEIHFEQQHITLEKADLDIRDIGRNKNPRVELRAHIGDGRVDAHGYLHLKRGELTKGFGRIRLFDVPVSTWFDGTSLKTLSGSITSHINQDTSWQSFGHISIQGEDKTPFELRVKILGNQGSFLAIDEMVINHKAIGAVQFTGQCEQASECAFVVNSKKIVAEPLLQALNIHSTTDLTLDNFQASVDFSGGQWFTSAEVAWPAFEYEAALDNSTKTIHMPSAKLQLSNLIWKNSKTWQINNLALLATEKDESDMEFNTIRYEVGHLELQLSLHQSTFWLPLSQWSFIQPFNIQQNIQGKGYLDGTISLGFTHDDLTDMNVNLDITHAEVRTQDMFKPLDTPLQLQGELLWEEDKLPSYVSLSMGLSESTFKLRHEQNEWFFSDMEINFDELKDVGIEFPESWSAWHGYIRGSTTLSVPEKDIVISQADVDLIQFGKDKHRVDGQIQTDGQRWQVQNLRWSQGKNLAEFFSRENNQFDIEAESLDGKALLLLQSLPFKAFGKLKSKILHLPFGNLTDISADYQVYGEDDHRELSLGDFKCSFYEGSLAAKDVRVSTINDALNLHGTIQVGGIHLNNWLWLHKQFGTHLEATIYATLNLEGNFGEKQTLLNWKGDGDVTVYNGKWLFHNKNITADKVSLNLRRRKEFNAQFNIKDGKKHGKGNIRMDTEGQVSGGMTWLDKNYQFSKVWPNFKFEEIIATGSEQP